MTIRATLGVAVREIIVLRNSTAPKMTIRIIAGILYLVVLFWGEAASAQTTYRLSVSHHEAVPALSKRGVSKSWPARRRCYRKIPIMPAT